MRTLAGVEQSEDADPESLDELLVGLDPQGRDFERLSAWFLRTDPEFAAEFETVWHWNDWPGNWGRDKGIDLIARKHDGRIVAIQAKNYGSQYYIKKSDVDSFLSESSRDVIDERLLIGTTELLGPNAREVIEAQSKPVGLCLLDRLREALVSWPASVGELSAGAPLILEPRPHQQAALEAIERWAQTDAERGQVLMACGTGKTLVAVRAADRLQAKRVLVLVPTLPLLRQTVSVWAGQAGIARQSIRVCSDQTDPDSEHATTTSELAFPTTTDPDAVAAFLRADGPRIVFATYSSSPVVAEALAVVPNAHFDLIVADEAHRCAGAAKKPTTTVLDNAKIRATRRLFFTATPTQFGPKDMQRARNVNVALASMDDKELFGPIVHHLSFADAVQQKLLCPYQVAVIPITDDEVQALIDHRRLVTADGDRVFEAQAMATQIACARAMRKYRARRIVAFHPRIEDSRRFAEHFPVAADLLPESDRPEFPLWSEHVDGDRMPRSRRTRLLRQFAQPGENFRILNNVKLLTEGVDVPAIDGIAFVDTRRGSVSVIQAVGRAMRPAGGKEVGTIVLPIIVRQDEDIGGALRRREHRGIVEILGALRSHDPDIFRSLDDLRFTATPDGQGQPPRRFVIDAPLDVDAAFADAVDVALTQALGTTQVRSPRRRAQHVVIRHPADEPELSDDEVIDRGTAVLTRYSQWRVAPAVPTSLSGFPLQPWWEEVKTRWLAGTLDDERKETLANTISWLAPDLGAPDSLIRSELRLFTTYSVPEQLDVQLSRQGLHATGRLAALGDARDFFDDDGLYDRLEDVHANVTHVAMSQRMQMHALIAAIRPLADAFAAARRDDEHFNRWNRSALLYGYTDRLWDDPDRLPHWTARSDPQAYLIGYGAAEPVLGLVRSTAMYRYERDEDEFDAVLSDDLRRPADERFDALSWDIFLLARHQDLPYNQAIDLARPIQHNTWATRDALRRQLLRRRQK